MLHILSLLLKRVNKKVIKELKVYKEITFKIKIISLQIAIIATILCRSGGIGRHVGFKIRFRKK